MDNEQLIPVEQVLDDMYSDGYASLPARDYYYTHYANDSERHSMDFEDKASTFLFFALFAAPVVYGIVCAILKFVF